MTRRDPPYGGLEPDAPIAIVIIVLICMLVGFLWWEVKMRDAHTEQFQHNLATVSIV